MKMILLRSVLISLFFLYVPLKAATQTCEDSFSGSVFIAFVQKHLGESWSRRMSFGWEQEIRRASRHWDRREANYFLDFLLNRVGIEGTIKIIGEIYNIKNIVYKDFMKRVALYGKYMEPTQMTHQLRRSFKGFYKGSTSKIRAVIKYMDEYIDYETTQELMGKHLNLFYLIRLSELKKIIQYMESYIGPEATKTLIKEDFVAFTKTFLEVKNVVEDIERRLDPEITKELVLGMGISDVIKRVWLPMQFPNGLHYR